MTLSNERRLSDVHRALQLMRIELADHWVKELRLEVGDPQFHDLAATTWRELQEHGWVEPMHAMGNPGFRLTAAGWLQALRLDDELQSPTTRDRAVQLVRAVKKHVDRHALHDTLFDHHTLVEGESGLPIGWIWNVVDSRLLQLLFPRDKMNIRWDARVRSFRVPPTVGQDWLPT